MTSCKGHTPSALQTWNLRELDTPGGSRSPVVVQSEDEARAVLIGLDPGQALGDHQVHERSWVVVIDGHVRFESGGETIDAGPGVLAWFEADERHSSRATKVRGSCFCSRRGPARATTTPTLDFLGLAQPLLVRAVGQAVDEEEHRYEDDRVQG